MTAEQFKAVLQLVESDADPRAYGDAEVHPAWVWTMLEIFGAAAVPQVSSSWEQLIGLISCGECQIIQKRIQSYQARRTERS